MLSRVSSNEHSLILSSSLKQYYLQDTFSDVTLVCNGKCFPAHRIILASFSNHFYEIFQMIKWSRAALVVLENVSAEDLEAVLHFIYNGEVSICMDRVQSFFNAAGRLKIKDLYQSVINDAELKTPHCVSENYPAGGSQNIPVSRSYQDALETNLKPSCSTPLPENPFRGDSRNIPNGWNDQTVLETDERQCCNIPGCGNRFGGDSESILKPQCPQPLQGTNLRSCCNSPPPEITPKRDPGDNATPRSNEANLEIDVESCCKNSPTGSLGGRHSESILAPQACQSVFEKDSKSQCAKFKEDFTYECGSIEETKTNLKSCANSRNLLTNSIGKILRSKERRSECPGNESDGTKDVKVMNENKEGKKRNEDDYEETRPSLRKRPKIKPAKYDEYELNSDFKDDVLSDNSIEEFMHPTDSKNLSRRSKNLKRAPLKCSECNYRTNNYYHLMEHVRIHTGEKPFKCNHCEYRAAQKSAIVSHVKIHSNSRSWPCTICSFTCKRKTVLTEHMKKHAVNSKQNGYSTRSKTVASEKIESGGASKSLGEGDDCKESKPSSKPLNEFVCDVCTFKTSAKEFYVSHRKELACDHCNFKTTCSVNMDIHSKTHIFV